MTAPWPVWVGVVGLPAVTLAMTALNLATWRARAGQGAAARVSALVPARNEVATIEACARSILAEPVHELVVYDDGSTDGTGAVLARLAAEDSRLRVLTGVTLPEGWVGKPHACHRLAEAATGDVLLFVDADVRLVPGAVGALLADDADVVTALPLELVGSLGEALIVPLLHLTYLSWLPLAAIRHTRDPRVLAANGQVLRVSRDAYERIGGFAAVRGAIVDDMALCGRAKGLGLTVAFVPGDRIASCRMYTSGAEAWRGFSKNLYPGLGHPLIAAVVAALYVGAFVVPWVVWPWWTAPALVGMALNLAQRLAIALRFGLPAWTAALHLPSALVFLAILTNSARWTRAGALQWRGRVYAHPGVSSGGPTPGVSSGGPTPGASR